GDVVGVRDNKRRGGIPHEARWGCWRRRRRIRLGGSWLACRTRNGIIGQGDRHLERYLYAGSIVKCRTTRSIVGDPKGTGGRAKRHAPRVTQHRILEVGHVCLIGNEL